MRRHEHGKDMQIVYLRMMLLGIDKGGYIYYQGVYGSLEEELAEEFDEPVEIIMETLDYLKENNMISIDENLDCFVPESLNLTGSECPSAERMRKKRQKNKTSQCDIDVTNSDSCVIQCDVEIEKEIEKDNIICAPEPHAQDDQLIKDFELIYDIYPKKRGRTVAFANYKQWISPKGKDVGGKRYRLTNKQIYMAVKKYVRQQRESGQDDLQYWKDFDTLMGRQLLDYVDFNEQERGKNKG